MQELVLAGSRDDAQWEQYIREADPAAAIFERARRIFEFQQQCKKEHGKQGGSRFAEFMKARFRIDKGTASGWASIGAATPKLLDNVQHFAADFLAVRDFVRLPEEQQVALLEAPGVIDRKAIKKFAITARREDIQRQRDAIESGAVDLPEGVYEVISIDPPWPYRDGVDQADYDPEGHRASNPYPEMSLEEIAALDLPASENCVLWLWTTHKFMRHSFALLDKWGFQDRAILTWVKDRMGLGRWLRSQSEFCIMATKGQPTISLVDQSTVLHGPMREHSRKPDEFYEMVDSLCVGRKLDFFSREMRAGWAQVGNEPEKFAA
jgi:N6-adenosine-specific RNA methylase IME4